MKIVRSRVEVVWTCDKFMTPTCESSFRWVGHSLVYKVDVRPPHLIGRDPQDCDVVILLWFPWQPVVWPRLQLKGGKWKKRAMEEPGKQPVDRPIPDSWKHWLSFLRSFHSVERTDGEMVMLLWQQISNRGRLGFYQPGWRVETGSSPPGPSPSPPSNELVWPSCCSYWRAFGGDSVRFLRLLDMKMQRKRDELCFIF